MRHDTDDLESLFDPGDYPALREFFPGYLHQDFVDEYGTPSEAVKGFLSEASADEIEQVKEEWKQLRKALRKKPFPEVQRALKRLGCAWVPENEGQVKGLDAILGDAKH